MNAQIDITGIRLTTERLVLRPWRYDDLEDFFAYASVDGFGLMAGWKPHRNMDESRNILSHFIRGKFRRKITDSRRIRRFSVNNLTQQSRI